MGKQWYISPSEKAQGEIIRLPSPKVNLRMDTCTKISGLSLTVTPQAHAAGCKSSNSVMPQQVGSEAVARYHVFLELRYKTVRKYFRVTFSLLLAPCEAGLAVSVCPI